jgi:hypothetical protein
MGIEPIKPQKPLADIKAIQAGLRDALMQTCADGKSYMQHYPTQLLTRTGYRRTGTLMESWGFDTVKTSGGAMSQAVTSKSSRAPYNRYVQGGYEQQSRLMRNAAWQNTDDLKERMQDNLVKLVREVFEQ